MITKNFLLVNQTSFQIGGICKYFIVPRNFKELCKALKFIQDSNLPYFFLGGGTNVLISDKYFNGIVLSTSGLNSISYNPLKREISALSGVSNTKLSEFAYSQSISGFEFMYYLPGTIGGSTYMNARCFGSSFSNIISHVKTVDQNLNIHSFLKEKSDFSYKTSLFQKNKHFIYKVVFSTTFASQFSIFKKMMQNKQQRIKKNHFLYPNAGCIFKNDYSIGIPTGEIIDQLNLKETSIGDAQIYSHHANFIINRGKANSKEVYDLSQLIKKKVFKAYNINLSYEIKFLGDFS